MKRKVPPDCISADRQAQKLKEITKAPRTTFCTLPRELRDKIYGYYYEDVYGVVKEFTLNNACEWPQLLPCKNITLVSKQIRQETFEDCKQAWTTFWTAHDFAILFDTEQSGKSYRELVDTMEKLLERGPVLTEMAFKVQWFDDEWTDTVSAKVAPSVLNAVQWDGFTTPSCFAEIESGRSGLRNSLLMSEVVELEADVSLLPVIDWMWMLWEGLQIMRRGGYEDG